MKQLLEALDLALEALRLYQRTLAPTATQIKGEEAITAIKQARSAPEEPLMVDIHPPATQRDRWMYEQGRLAERDPRSHAAPVQEPAWYHAECDDPDYSRFTQEKDEAFAIVSDKGGYVTELYTRAQPAPVQEPVTQDVQEKCRIEVVPAKGGLLPAAPVQEPDHGNELTIAYMSGLHDGKKKREWVSLTADERYDIRASFRGRFLETSEFAEQVQLATEAKLKEKNT
jgi:hypothetical protein